MIAVPVNADPIGELDRSAAAASVNDDGARDYITMDDILPDMADDAGGGGDDQEAIVRDPKDVELFEGLTNRLGEDDVLFGGLEVVGEFQRDEAGGT